MGWILFFRIISVNFIFTKKCYESQFLRNENTHKLCCMPFIHICIIFHAINKFCQRMQSFAFFPRLIFANVATLYVKNVERRIYNIYHPQLLLITFVAWLLYCADRKSQSGPKMCGMFYWIDLIENWYQRVIWVAEYQFEVKIWNFEMAGSIWWIKIWKNLMNWRISMRVGSWSPHWIFIFHLKFVFSDPNNPLVPIFIQLRQLIGFFKIYGRHIGSAISKFRIFTLNSYSATQITP